MKRILLRSLLLCGLLTGQSVWGYVVHVVQQIEVDGVLTIQRYGFRMDENGEWVFVMLSEL